MSKMSTAQINDTPSRADRLELRVAELEEEKRILLEAMKEIRSHLTWEPQPFPLTLFRMADRAINAVSP